MFGDWGGCMTFTLMTSIFGLYCTNVLGVDPVLMGTLTIIWTVWDAINDPMMGALMDKAFAKKHNKNGKFRPWLLRATPLLAVSAICLWTVPTFLDGIPMLVALFAFKILYEASYTMFNIPMGSLLSAMSTNDSERASLSSARGVGSMFGNMIPALAGHVLGLKVLCVLVPAVFILGSWAAFKFVWNITPEVREKMAAHKAAQK